MIIGPNRNVLIHTHLLFMTIHGVFHWHFNVRWRWSSKSPLLSRTPLYLIMNACVRNCLSQISILDLLHIKILNTDRPREFMCNSRFPNRSHMFSKRISWSRIYLFAAEKTYFLNFWQTELRLAETRTQTFLLEVFMSHMDGSLAHLFSDEFGGRSFCGKCS